MKKAPDFDSIQPGDLLIVHWVDSATSVRYWMTDDFTVKHTKAKTVGWLNDRHRDSIMLVQTKSNGSETGGNITIPKVAITGLKKLM